MTDSWVTITIRFRPDQIRLFNEIYPDKPFAPSIRLLLDAFLDGKNPNETETKDLIRLREQTRKKLQLLEQEIELKKREEHKLMINEALERERRQFISEHPRYLELFQAGTMSTKGYQDLQRELKLTSKQQVVEWLNELVVE